MEIANDPLVQNLQHQKILPMNLLKFFRAATPACFPLYRICLFFLFFALAGASTAGAGVTFTWQANPPEDYVIGYRLYYGPESRYRNSGALKANFSYAYYIDFLEFKRCIADGTDANCQDLSASDFQCANLYGEAPQCTVNNLQGLLYFALTAYNAQAESGFTPELNLTINPEGSAVPAGSVVDAMSWTLSEAVRKVAFHGVWGGSASNLYTVGQRGTILHYDGTGWDEIPSGTRKTLYSVWGSSGSDVYAVGQNGTILHYNGSEWYTMEAPTKRHLYAVWGSSGSDVYAVGQRGTILHYDGTSWDKIPSGTRKSLYSVWGSSGSDVYAVGQGGTVLHYNGGGWNSMDTPTHNHLYGIWGSSSANVFAVGRGGTILEYNGGSWNTQLSGTRKTLYGVWGSSATNVFAVGQHGTLLHFDGATFLPYEMEINGWLRDIWGSLATSDIYAVGSRGRIYHGN